MTMTVTYVHQPATDSGVTGDARFTTAELLRNQIRARATVAPDEPTGMHVRLVEMLAGAISDLVATLGGRIVKRSFASDGSVTLYMYSSRILDDGSHARYGAIEIDSDCDLVADMDDRVSGASHVWDVPADFLALVESLRRLIAFVRAS